MPFSLHISSFNCKNAHGESQTLHKDQLETTWRNKTTLVAIAKMQEQWAGLRGKFY
jgi:hypothetical protein